MRQIFAIEEPAMKSLASFAVGFVIVFSPTASGVAQERAEDEHSYARPEEGLVEHIWTPRALRRLPQCLTEPWHCCIISGPAAT